MIRIALVALAVALPLLSCGPSPERKADLARRTVRSWTATVRKTEGALERQAISPLYARQVIDAAREGRNEESASPEWTKIPSRERAELDLAIRRLAAALDKPDSETAR